MLGDHQILQHRHAGKQPDILEGAGDARLRRNLEIGHAFQQKQVAGRGLAMAGAGRGQRRHIGRRGNAGAGQRKTSFRRLVKAGDAVEDGGLARAIGADQRGDVAASGLEGQRVDGDKAAKPHGEVFDNQQGIGLPAHQPCPSFTRAPETALLSFRKIEGSRVAMIPRGFQIIMNTIAMPNSSMRYCAGSKSVTPNA